jgi:hypothetical protein
MIIHENEEILISELMSNIKKYFETQEYQYVTMFRDKLNYILKNESNDLINYILDLLEDYYKNNNYDLFFEKHLQNVIEYKEANNKKYIVIAIPLLLIGYRSTTDLEFVRKRKYFDNRLFKLQVDIEYILLKKLNTKYKAHLKLHDEFLDMSQLQHKYSELNNLKNEMFQDKKDRSKNSLLSKKRFEEYEVDKQDGLKFILGVIEFDSREKINEVFKNSFEHINQDYKTLKSRFDDLFINQQIALENCILLPPSPLISAMEEGWTEFHYQVLFNLVSNMLSHKSKHKINVSSVYIKEKEIIYILFFDNENKEIPFSRIDIQFGVVDFEEELRLINDIFFDLGVSHKIVRK